MRSNIILAVSIICLLTSCVKEKFETEAPTPTPGSEVKFTADLGTTLTKTMYGDEVDTNADGTNDAVKVHWVDEDLISVYGTTCSVKQAEYSVIGATSVDGYSYAASLTKTGAAGVQWGAEATSDFIAVYPSTTGAISNNDGSVTIPTSIDAVQYNVFTKTSDNVWLGTAFDHEKNTGSMPNAIMYAYSDEAKSGETVNLRFKPFSTVLKFHVNSWYANQENPDMPTDPTGKTIQVKSIKFTAPEAVAGDFNMTVTSAGVSTVESVGTGSKTITLEPQAPINWLYGQALEFCIFAIPKSGISLSENWKVVISTSDGDKTFSLKPKTGANATLAAGKIHKINVKNGFPVNSVWTYETSTWMKSIPRNVYIADLSLPGSWYACDSGYQDGTLAQQYAAGIRAFNIDCRLTLKENLTLSDYGERVLSHYTGILNIPVYDLVYKEVETHAIDTTKLILACSGTEKRNTGQGYINSMMRVKNALISLGTMAEKNPEEYIEVIITVAQRPKAENAVDIYDEAIYGTINPKMVLAAITQVLNDADVKKYLYTGQITPNTTLNNVCGKVIVKVNLNASEANIKSWNTTASPMLISTGSMAVSDYFSDLMVLGNFTSMNTENMYWSANTTSNLKYYYHQAQNTTGTSPYPTVGDRKTAIESILSQSYAEYSSNKHNGWYQLGIGGWTADNATGKNNLSAELKPYVYGIVNSMLTGEAYNDKTYEPAPVGAVLMNHTTATTNKTAELIKAIIDLNGAYFLNRDVNQEAWPGATLNSVPTSNGAYAVVGEDAF